MKRTTDRKEYTWDIAISLCKQDVEFGSKLVKALNPSLKIFFYEYKQEELITKSGPEEFSKIFKEQSRIVVILSRNEWSKSYYTDIERNAIIDRTSVKNEGYQFLMIIPMEPGEIPSWYPSTRIYVDPFKFTIDEIARFIEFKVAQEGGNLKSLTLEDRYEYFLQRVDEKKLLIQLQQDPIAIESAKNEIVNLKECFNQKCQFLRKNIIGSTSYNEFGPNDKRALFGINEYLLECEIKMPDEIFHKIVTTQDFYIFLKLFKGLPNRLLQEEEQRVYYYSSHLTGWSIQKKGKRISHNENSVLFRNRDNSLFYDLSKPITTLTLIDYWFQKLFTYTTQVFEEYL